jgi:hypothetical protein
MPALPLRPIALSIDEDLQLNSINESRQYAEEPLGSPELLPLIDLSLDLLQ